MERYHTKHWGKNPEQQRKLHYVVDPSPEFNCGAVKNPNKSILIRSNEGFPMGIWD